MKLKIFFDISTGFRFSKISVECSVHLCSCPWLIQLNAQLKRHLFSPRWNLLARKSQAQKWRDDLTPRRLTLPRRHSLTQNSQASHWSSKRLLKFHSDKCITTVLDDLQCLAEKGSAQRFVLTKSSPVCIKPIQIWNYTNYTLVNSTFGSGKKSC